MDAEPASDFTYNADSHTVTIAAKATGSAVVLGFASEVPLPAPDCTINIRPETSGSGTVTPEDPEQGQLDP